MCLFSLDKHEAVPVDTHVWQFAKQYYAPELEGKTLTPRIMGRVQQVLEGRFGAYAGWAHTALFIAELVKIRSWPTPCWSLSCQVNVG